MMFELWSRVSGAGVLRFVAPVHKTLLPSAGAFELRTTGPRRRIPNTLCRASLRSDGQGVPVMASNSTPLLCTFFGI